MEFFSVCWPLICFLTVSWLGVISNSAIGFKTGFSRCQPYPRNGLVSINSEMELFQFYQKICKQMGILPIPANRHFVLNWRILLILLFICNFLISSLIFLSLNAKSMLDIGDSVFMCISAIVGIALVLVTIWKMPIVSRIIAQFQEIIEKSKNKSNKQTKGLTWKN